MATMTANTAGKRRYLKLQAAVSEALRRADPLGLLEAGAPADEYDLEVNAILPPVSRAASVDEVTLILHERFVQGVGVEGAGDIETYRKPATDIWRALSSLGFR